MTMVLALFLWFHCYLFWLLVIYLEGVEGSNPLAQTTFIGTKIGSYENSL